jgi:hypothetical protein
MLDDFQIVQHLKTVKKQQTFLVVVCVCSMFGFSAYFLFGRWSFDQKQLMSRFAESQFCLPCHNIIMKFIHGMEDANVQ